MTSPTMPPVSPWQPRMDLDTIASLPWSPLPAALRGATVTTPLTPPALCPRCDAPMASLLSGCRKPECRAAELNEDAFYARLADA